MSCWQIEFTTSAEREFGKLSSEYRKEIRDYLRQKVSTDPRIHGTALRMTSAIKLWRYRVRDHRIICQLLDHTVTVLVIRIGSRDSVYKKL